MKYLSLILFLCSLSSFAKNWQINPDHSQIIFSIGYLKFSTVEGSFKRFNGYLTLKEEKISDLEILINSESIDTGNNLRDGHLKRSDFLDAKKYPIISFTMKKIDQDNIIGELTIKDVSKTISFKIDQSPILSDPWNKDNFFTRFESKINRQDYNMNWNQMLDTGGQLLGDTITIYGNIQWQPQGKKTLGSKHLIADTPALRIKDRPTGLNGNLEDDVIIKKLPETKEGINLATYSPPPTDKSFKWFHWLSYGFIWFTSLGGVLIGAYYIKTKKSVWWTDLLILIMIFVFALSIYELMPNN